MKLTPWAMTFAAWLIAACSMLGALFLGEVMGFTPCLLCWYQRIFMFPLVLVLAVGLFPLDPKIARYALPLALGGLAVAIYHVLLTAGVIPESMTPCTQGVPCAKIQIQWFGFVTIPLLSVFAFAAIAALLVMVHLKVKQ